MIDVDVRAAIDALVPRGYRWWYLDGLSDDGRRGFTAIFMIGSNFSPWLNARAQRGEAVPAHEHLGVHLALYEDRREVAWTMSEYPTTALDADRSSLRIGGSRLEFESDGSLRATFDERTAPPFWSGLGIGWPMRGRVRLTPSGDSPMLPVEIGRSSTGASHHWQVRAPHGRIEVEFDRPGFRFVGSSYHDTNWGTGRLEESFTRWSWARFHDGDRTRILYAVEPRQDSTRGFVVESHGSGLPTVRHDRPARFDPATSIGWGLRAPSGFVIDDPAAGHAEVVRWLDRTPFYARYVARLGALEGVGEYLDLDRFLRPTVQFLLRWRAQRRV